MILFRSKLMSGAAVLSRMVCSDDNDPPPNEGGNDNSGGAAPPADGAAPPADGAAPPADGAAPPADGAAPPAAAAPATDWRDREIKRKHAQLQQEKRAREELEQRLEAANALIERQAAPPADGAAPPAPDRRSPLAPAATQDEVNAAAQRIVNDQNFAQAANNADAEGKKLYGAEWDQATDRLATLGGFDKATMNSILATDNPAQVIHALGSKPEEFQRIMELPEARRQTELVKLGLPKPKSPNKRPDPDAAPPVDGVHSRPRASGDELRDDLPDDDWYARRQRQKAARFAAKQAGKLPVA